MTVNSGSDMPIHTTTIGGKVNTQRATVVLPEFGLIMLNPNARKSHLKLIPTSRFGLLLTILSSISLPWPHFQTYYV